MYATSKHKLVASNSKLSFSDIETFEKMYSIIFEVDPSLIFKVVERSKDVDIPEQLLVFMYNNFFEMRSEDELLFCYEKELRKGIQALRNTKYGVGPDSQTLDAVSFSLENKQRILDGIKSKINIGNFLDYSSYLCGILNIDTLFYHAIRNKWNPKNDYLEMKDKMNEIFKTYPKFKSLKRPENNNIQTDQKVLYV